MGLWSEYGGVHVIANVSSDDGARVPLRSASVSLQLMLKQVVDLNTVAQTVDMMTWWRHSWLDPRLAWDPAAYGGISKLVFKGFGTLWVPDTMVRDRARAATVGG